MPTDLSTRRFEYKILLISAPNMMSARVIYFACLVTVVVCSPIFDLERDPDNASAYYEKYLELDQELRTLADKGVKKILSTFLETSGRLNISSRCIRNTFALIGGIRELKIWALRFLDASPKMPEGLFTGYATTLGDFHECLSTRVPTKNGGVDFQGQYCLVNYAPFLPKLEQSNTADVLSSKNDFMEAVVNGSDFIRFVAKYLHHFRHGDGKVGLCVPSGCTPNDVERVLKYITPKIMVNASLDSCQIEDAGVNLNKKQIFFICGCSFFITIGIIASFVEYWQKKSEGEKRSVFMDVVLCFSLTRNFQNIINEDLNPDTRSLACLHGIRVLSAFFIIFVHRCILIVALVPSSGNLALFEDLGRRFSFQLVSNGGLLVDVFMFIGGFLHSYLRTGKDSSGKIFDKNPRYLSRILLRIYRLAPIYITSVFLSFMMVFPAPFLPDITERMLKNCERKWWWNLLFLHNFLHTEDMCLPHTWYISSEMQIFLLSLLPIGYLIRNQNVGLFLGSMLSACGIVTTMIWCWVVDVPPAIITFNLSKESGYRHLSVYMLPLPHIATYFTGVFLGFYLAKENSLKIPKIYQVIGWPLSFLLSTAVMFVPWKWNNGIPYTRIESALYFTFSRILYVFGVSWVVLCCVTGHGGFINYILSLKLWIPLSRLSYAIYLISLLLQIFYNVNYGYAENLHIMQLIWMFLGDLVISSLLALTFVLIFESPAFALQKRFFQPRAKNSKQNEVKRTEGTDNATFEPKEIALSELKNGKQCQINEDKSPLPPSIKKYM